MIFLTEQELRTRFGLGQGGEIRLRHDERLTPAAWNLVRDRKIRVLHVDPEGRTAVGDEAGDIKRVPVLRTDTSSTIGRQCSQCGCAVREKPEGLTHLDASTLAPKTHPRIILRGKLDSTIASVVLAQTQYDPAKALPKELATWLSDLRSWLGQILRAEVTGEAMPDLGMGDFDFTMIHAMSHAPERHLGHDHIVPDASHGFNAALLNKLRAEVREVELSAAGLACPERPDIVRALNRLSSAFYVLMICTLLAEAGKPLPVPTTVPCKQ